MDLDLKKLTDLREKGAPKEGVEQALDRRLFIQLLAFGGCGDWSPQVRLLKESRIECALYADINDPCGIALLTMNEDPQFFVTELRELLKREEFSGLGLKTEYTMLGRTYALGHERDLEDWLLKRPLRIALNPEWPWAVWYPLRRKGSFALLSPKEQEEILREHGLIGRAFGEADLGHDIRLSSFGLDKNDNDFVIGLTGKDLHPLSALVQVMRRTRQTSTHVEKMGPFFTGKAVWQYSSREL